MYIIGKQIPGVHLVVKVRGGGGGGQQLRLKNLGGITNFVPTLNTAFTSSKGRFRAKGNECPPPS